ncbi:hypothetical protein MSG28_007299 [Choristoneura fumiferana]|uniref:Uncharacterized protein n=2 Tax=Choristoneura fumiferana TaxID=7141 RepID=A0ACC0JWK2_CHOFU|nr:hypothetical protein MSG28_007297 [Choristoneura fumiferana]KAI8428526.1 hypothetical protein MSG28_007299 [Choristoneura fumiferana]
MAETDLADLRKQCITSLYLCSDNISKYLEDNKEAEFAKLKSYVEDYCILESQQEEAIQALERAKRETDASNVDTLQERFDANLQSLANTRSNVNNHPYMMEIKKRIQRGMQMSRNNLEESDMAITESDNRPIDPITKRPIEDPVKNTVCGHIYDREAIMNLLNLKKKIKCPVAGCGNRNPINPNQLISDEELKFQMSLNTHSTMIQQSMMNLDDSD